MLLVCRHNLHCRHEGILCTQNTLGLKLLLMMLQIMRLLHNRMILQL